MNESLNSSSLKKNWSSRFIVLFYSSIYTVKFYILLMICVPLLRFLMIFIFIYDI